jgi:hypothetical protein
MIFLESMCLVLALILWSLVLARFPITITLAHVI